MLSAHRKPGDDGLAVSTSSPYRLPWAQTEVGSEQQYKCFFLQPNSLPPLRSQGEETSWWDFPAGPTVKTAPSNAGGEGSIPGQGAKIPAAT